jgi:hypothetical protein
MIFLTLFDALFTLLAIAAIPVFFIGCFQLLCGFLYLLKMVWESAFYVLGDYGHPVRLKPWASAFVGFFRKD